MAKLTHPLLAQVQENPDAEKLTSRAVQKTLGRWLCKTQFKLAGGLKKGGVVLTSCICLTYGSYAKAQIIPDETWGAEASVVTPNGTLSDFLIEAGARRDTNLFHSFEQFDIGAGQSVYFDSPQGVENIFSRVKGNDASDILGTLGVNGGANLFLINPNGIIFGDNAMLKVQGSFVATTASGIQFGEQGFFSATHSEVPPLLTVNPSAFLFNQITPGRIESRSIAFVGFDLFGSPLYGLEVPKGRSLLLVGGDILIDGQIEQLGLGAGLTALEGRLELVAIAGSGTVELNVDGNNLSLNVPPEIPRADISLTNGAFVTTAGDGGGDIQVWGKQITLTDASVIASGSLGAGNSGNLVVNASKEVQASGLDTGFFTNNGATGDAGDVIITTPVLQLRDGAVIVTGTSGTGNSGNLVVNASKEVHLSGRGIVGVEGFPSGLRTDASGEGDGGDITINTPLLLVEDGAVISSSTFPESTGDGGDITVFASDSVQLSESRIVSQAEGEGDAGNVRIDTPLLTVQNQAQITADTIGSNSGNAGIIEINAAQVQLDSSGRIESKTLGEGDAGDILLQVEDSLIISGDGSGLFANTTADSTGRGGSIFIDPKTLVVRDGGQIAVDSQGTEIGGNIRIESDSLILDNQARLSAETATNTGGDITLIIDNLLLLRRGSRISTTAGQAEQPGSGGNITIKADLIVGVPKENSDITANAFEGEGGIVRIETQGLFNLVIRSREDLEALLGTDASLDPEVLDSNDITAISQTSPQLSRIPTLILLRVDPSQGLVELPADIVDATKLVEQSLCVAAQGSEFIVTGRGGLPTPPNEALNTDAAWEDWRITTQGESTEVRQPNPVSRQQLTANNPKKIVEAQGWFKDANGTIILTAEPTVVTPHEILSSSLPCQ